MLTFFIDADCMVGQINSVLCYFEKLPSFVKSKLLYAYCGSLCGSELWDLWNNNTDTVCVAWRKALRRVWNLPFNTHCDILYELSNTLPALDVICKRVLSFITKCANSDCYIVKAVARHAVLHGHMTLPQCFVLRFAIIRSNSVSFLVLSHIFRPHHSTRQPT